MAEGGGVLEQQHPNLHLSPEERRLFGQLFAAADQEKLNVVTGEVAVKFFEKTRLPSAVLGEIWQIADVENRGLLTPPGFGIVLRLIGYAQAGHQVSPELALKPGGPLPKFDGISAPSFPLQNIAPSLLQPQGSGGPIRVPSLTPEKAEQFASLFEQSGAQNGLLSGETAKQLFEKVTHLPNEVLGRIWNLADTEQKGELNLTGFIIAMHLIACYREGLLRVLPQILPAGLYEAASRRGVSRPVPGSRPPSGVGSAKSIPRQFSGSRSTTAPITTARPVYQQSQLPLNRPSEEWAVNHRDKEDFDRFFSTVDTANRGFITGDQAVVFFRNSNLPEDALAQIWDLADINSEGRLSRDEFAVAMFLICQQRTQRDGRKVIPEVLPPSLIPPSMRHQAGATPSTTTPVFNNNVNSAASNQASEDLFGTAASKQASEDLFGLDSWTTPATQIPQTTGDSGLYSATPPHIQGSPQQIQPAQQPQKPHSLSAIKPFVPSSSFGQAITSTIGQTTLSPQSTGLSLVPKNNGLSNLDSSALNRNTQQKFPTDDLLGDNDPEVSRKLTQETTELANLSNQVSNLTGQMQIVKTNRMSTEQDLSNAQSQKRDFEARLSQLRSAYEQEVMSVKVLEDRLSSIRIETKRLDQEMALLNGAYQDLQSQHGQIERGLQLEQRENTELKERIRQTNNEIQELRPQLEKMKSDARQQKGLVAINKKQLVTNEAESEKLKSEIEGVSKELREAKLEAEETTRLLEKVSESKGLASTTSPISPTTNMNPFFRHAPSVPSEKSASSPYMTKNPTSPNHDAFESFFGSAVVPSHSQPGPPSISLASDLTSNYSESPQQKLTSAQSVKSSEGPDLQTPTDSPPPSAYNDMPQLAGEPPAPPQSRQTTSSILPMRFLQRSESTSSSVKVVPPESRAGELSGFETPTERQPSFSEAPEPDVLRQRLDMASTNSMNDNSQQSTQPTAELGLPSQGRVTEDEHRSLNEDESHIFGKPSTQQQITGALPTESSAKPQPLTSHDTLSTLPNPSDVSPNRERDPLPRADEQLQFPRAAKDDLNAAFIGFGNKSKTTENFNWSAKSGDFGNADLPQTQGEFPPIQDVGPEDDESDTDSDLGFEDNFTAASPQRKTKYPNETQSFLPKERYPEADDASLAPLRPPMLASESNQSQPPTPGAQISPPTYDQTVAPNGQSRNRRDSNQFPAEYIGLLPSREILNTPPLSSAPISDQVGLPAANEKGTEIFGGPIMGEPLGGLATFSGPPPLAPGASTAPYAYDHKAPMAAQPQPPVPAKTALDDDFDNEFGDLSEAKEADDKVDDDFASARKDGFDDFNPVFDSPPPSGSSTHLTSNANQKYNSFHDFESTADASPNSRQPADPNSSNQSHDWDAIFSGLETNKTNGVQPDSQHTQGFSVEQTKPQAPHPTFESSKPPLSRVISTGTEHDDPILKRLTGMGYPRETSLKALEKFDYNIDKAADYLTSNP